MRYVCVVSRDHPLLAGYLLVALTATPAAPDEVRIVLDRRRDIDAPGPERGGAGRERRHRAGLEAELRVRPFVFVPEPPQGPVPRPGVPAGVLDLERDRPREGIRWPLTLALGIFGAALAISVLAVWPPPGPVGPSRAVTTAPTRDPPREEPPAAAVSPVPQAMPSSPAPAPGSEAPGAPGPSLPARSAPVDPGPPATEVLDGSVHRASGFPWLPEVELASRREGRGPGQRIVFTARVRDASGAPVQGADVSLLEVGSDGTRREVRLAPVSAPGAYRGAVPAGALTQGDLRVRVAVDGQRFEVPVAR